MKILRGGLIAMVVALSVPPGRRHRAPRRPPATYRSPGLPASPFASAISTRRGGTTRACSVLPEAFTTSERWAGRAASVFFKVNDDQYIEVVPGLAPGGINREARVTFQSTDLNRLHDMYAAEG